MPSKYWIKLYHEILDDPKMGRLSDRLFRRTIEFFLLAGEVDRDGELPPLPDIAWRLRTDDEQLETEMIELQRIGILSYSEGEWVVTKFADRQSAVSGAERVARYRQRKRQDEYYETDPLPISNDDVTDRYTDTDTDTDTEVKSAPHPIHEMLALWGELFPNKPQPKPTTKSIRSKVDTRFKSDHFAENWRRAMYTASRSPTLQKESWFDFRFFIRNDDNYQKCLDNWMAWKDQRLSDNGDKVRTLEGYEYAGS